VNDETWRQLEASTRLVVCAARRWRTRPNDPERIAALRKATDEFYSGLTPAEQWAIDKELGILDD
jgi:hypothetical protein